MKLTWSTEKEKSKFPFTLLRFPSDQTEKLTNQTEMKKRALTWEKKTGSLKF